MMDDNLSAGEKFLAIARDKVAKTPRDPAAIQEAIRLAQKATRLNPGLTISAKVFIDNISLNKPGYANSQGSSSFSSFTSASSSSSPFSSMGAGAAAASTGSTDSLDSSGSKTTAPAAASENYSPDQKKVIHEILGSSTHYTSLQISVAGDRTAVTKAQVVSAFRKVSRLIHPDKCSHPKTNEAFLKVKRAYDVLSDESKKAQYDQFLAGGATGIDPTSDDAAAQMHLRRRQQQQQYAHMGGHPQMFEEDLFDLLFRSAMHPGMAGGFQAQFGGPRPPPRHPRYQQQQQAGSGGIPLGLIQAIAFLVLAFIIMRPDTSSSERFLFRLDGGSDPAAAGLRELFTKGPARWSESAGWPYYVDPEFGNEPPDIEQRVLQEYAKLQNLCKRNEYLLDQEMRKLDAAYKLETSPMAESHRETLKEKLLAPCRTLERNAERRQEYVRLSPAVR